MVDIAAKLFPNVVTILSQLCATYIIYRLYRKYIHQSVLNYLDAREQAMTEASETAEFVKKEAELNKEKLAQERKQMLREVDEVKSALMKEANDSYASRLDEANRVMEQEEKSFRQSLEVQKQEMVKDVEEHAVDLAYELSKKTLNEFDMSEEMMLKRLEESIGKVK